MTNWLCNLVFIFYVTLGANKLPDTRFFFWHTTNPFLRFFRIRKENNQPILVYEGEYVSNNRNPNWKKIEILAQKLCNGDYDMPIKVEVWDYRTSGDHVKVGETSFTVNTIKDAKGMYEYAINILE